MITSTQCGGRKAGLRTKHNRGSARAQTALTGLSYFLQSYTAFYDHYIGERARDTSDIDFTTQPGNKTLATVMDPRTMEGKGSPMKMVRIEQNDYIEE